MRKARIPVIAVGCLLLFAFLFACASQAGTPTATPKPDTSRYSAAQVVDLTKTLLMKDATNAYWIMELQKSRGSATYEGDGQWLVTLVDSVTQVVGKKVGGTVTAEIEISKGQFTFRESTETVVARDSDAAQMMGGLRQRQ